jgi:hypothetical protein
MLAQALVDLAQEDTGPGGLRVLTGREYPVVYASAMLEIDTPSVTFFFPSAGEGIGQGEDVRVQFSTWVSPNDADDFLALGRQISRRLLTLYTQPALATKGVDAAPDNLGLTELPGDTVGIVQEIEFLNTTY